MSDTRLRFETDLLHYRHWEVDVDGPIATLSMSVDPAGGLRDDYELKLNSYDLSVDIELHDALQRLRFEHPSVKAIVITGALDKVFSAGANDEAYVHSLMQPVTDAGKMAGWIAPPSVRINGKPVDFEYVRVA